MCDTKETESERHNLNVYQPQNQSRQKIIKAEKSGSRHHRQASAEHLTLPFITTQSSCLLFSWLGSPRSHLVNVTGVPSLHSKYIWILMSFKPIHNSSWGSTREEEHLSSLSLAKSKQGIREEGTGLVHSAMLPGSHRTNRVDSLLHAIDRYGLHIMVSILGFSMFSFHCKCDYTLSYSNIFYGSFKNEMRNRNQSSATVTNNLHSGTAVPYIMMHMMYIQYHVWIYLIYISYISLNLTIAYLAILNLVNTLEQILHHSWFIGCYY